MSALFDFNTDAAVSGDRKTDVSAFDSSQINACAVAPSSVDQNEFDVLGHEFSPVGNNLGGDNRFSRGEGFGKCLDFGLNYGVLNEEYGFDVRVSENGSTSVEFKVNREAIAEDNMIDNVYVKADDDRVFADGFEDHCVPRTEEFIGQSPNCVLHVEAKDDEVLKESLRETPISANNLCQEEPPLETSALPEEIKSQTMDVNVTEASPLRNVQRESHGLNLVVDFNSCSKMVEVDMDMEPVFSEFHVSDLVWGKVKGHPWWPGQIVDPSVASKKAKKHFKKESYLIAYFGDMSFAWNDASKIKPFQMYFSQMERQSNSDNFCRAVDCALVEMSRRVEFGLSCPCTPEVFAKLKTQIITNDGIQARAGRRDRGDKLLNAIAFEPKKLVNFVKLLAESPLVEFDRLDFSVAGAQLLAFRHSKVYSQLSEFKVNGALLKNDTQFTSMDMDEKEHYDHQIDSHGLETDTGYSHKRKHSSRRDGVWTRKKQKRLSDLMSENCLRLPNDKQKPYENTADDNSHEFQNILPFQLHKVSVDEMWRQFRLAATDPTRDGYLTVMVNFFIGFRNFPNPHNSTPIELYQDSYWTDRIIQSFPEGQSLLDEQDETEEFLHLNITEGAAPCFNPLASADGNECSDKSSMEDTCPAALVLEFTNFDSVPSKARLNKIFGRFGPLMESQTEILKKSRCARVVFKRLSDAENAFSSSGKYSTFGPSLLRYHLKVMPSSSVVPNGAGKKGRKRNSGKSVEL